MKRTALLLVGVLTLVGNACTAPDALHPPSPDASARRVATAPLTPAPMNAIADVSLAALADRGRVLKNPDKGFYHHFYDNAVNKYLLSSDSHLTNFPGMDHLYIRLAWSYFEPTEGQFNWSYIDNLVNKWLPQGYSFSFRVTCKETSITYATPEWVKNAGARGQFVNNYGTQRWEPDYNDPIFRQKLDNFHKAMAARYDGQPWLRYIDVGSLGDWGEGHTNPSSNVVIPNATVQNHLDIYNRWYRNTRLFITDDLIYWNRSATDATSLRTYAESRGYTYRDDSILVKYYVNTYPTTGSVSHPQLFTDMYTRRPIILEPQHYGTVKTDGNWQGTNGSTRGAEILRTAIRNLRPTYIGYHGYADAWLTDNPQLARELANWVGYWFIPARIKTGDLRVGQSASIELQMENAGVAPGYQRYNAYLKLVNTSTGAEFTTLLSSIDSRTWLPGRTTTSTATITLPTTLARGTYAVRLALKREVSGHTTRFVELGLNTSSRKSDSFYQLINSVSVN